MTVDFSWCKYRIVPMEFWEQWKILELGRFVMKLQLWMLPRVSTCTENSYHWSRCQKINVPWELQRTCRNLESEKKVWKFATELGLDATLCMHSDFQKKQCDVTISIYRSSEKLNNWSHGSSAVYRRRKNRTENKSKRFVFSHWRNCIVCDQSICWTKNEKDWRFGGSCYTCEDRRQILPILFWESEKIQRGSFCNCSLRSSRFPDVHCELLGVCQSHPSHVGWSPWKQNSCWRLSRNIYTFV